MKPIAPIRRFMKNRRTRVSALRALMLLTSSPLPQRVPFLTMDSSWLLHNLSRDASRPLPAFFLALALHANGSLADEDWTLLEKALARQLARTTSDLKAGLARLDEWLSEIPESGLAIGARLSGFVFARPPVEWESLRLRREDFLPMKDFVAGRLPAYCDLARLEKAGIMVGMPI